MFFGEFYLNIIFLNIIVNVNFLVIWNLNISVSTSLKNFLEKLLGHEKFRSPGLRNIFWKICKTLRPLPPLPTYFMYAP